MKIACITVSRLPSTTAHSIQAVKACQALQQAGNQVCLWVPGTEPADWGTVAEYYGLSEPFEIRWLPSRPWLKRYDLIWQSFQQARVWGAELVYTWLVQDAYLALRYGLPAILELHAPLTGKLGPWFFRRFLAHPGRKKTLVITAALQKMLQTEYGPALSNDQIQIAPNGFEENQYLNLPVPSAARKKLNLPECFTAGYTGHLYAGRGMELLSTLAGEFPHVQFLWVGGTPQDIQTWRERLENRGIQNVVLTGFVHHSQLPLYQAAADILLMPYDRIIRGSSGGNSVDYCSPMKMFDYLAAGRPIISSDLAVIHEVLNTDNAILCPPEDIPAWVQALRDLLADPDRQARLTAQAKKDADRYTWLERARRALVDL